MWEVQGDQQLIWQLQQAGRWVVAAAHGLCVRVCVEGLGTGLLFWLLQESGASLSLGVGRVLGISECGKQS